MASINKPENSNFEKLVSKLKTEDSNYAKISKAIQIMYWIFIPLFALLSFLEYSETNEINHIISGGSFILAFLIFALFFRKYYKEYKYVDYSLPTIQMLKKAAYRYKPFQLKSLWILFALGFMDIGLTIDWQNDFPLIIIQAIFLGIMVFAAIIGLILWFYKYKPIRDEALRLIDEIEGQ